MKNKKPSLSFLILIFINLCLLLHFLMPDCAVKNQPPDDISKQQEEAMKFAKQFEETGNFYFSQAAQWYRKAALKGQIEAQFKLGIMYLNGRGIEEDSIAAVYWLKKAAAQGHEDAKSWIDKLRDQVIEFMETENYQQAYQLASQFETLDMRKLAARAKQKMEVTLTELRFLYIKGDYKSVIAQGTPKIGYSSDIKKFIEQVTAVQIALKQVSKLMEENKFQAAYELASQFENHELQTLAIRLRSQIDVALAELRYLYTKGDYDNVIIQGTPKIEFSDEIKKLVEQAHKIKPTLPIMSSPQLCSVNEEIRKYLSSNIEPDKLKLNIEDSAHNLERFFEALTELKNGKRKKVRVAMYGGSNHTIDWAASSLRNIWGKLFGFGGHGFVAAGQPWARYQHQEINVKSSKKDWVVKAMTIPKYEKPYYGHAGILGIGTAKDGFVNFYPQKKGHIMNRGFSQIQVHYLCQPDGGSFNVYVDKKRLGTITTSCKKRRLKTEQFKVKLGEHEVKLKVVKPNVLVFGVVFENDEPGIVVDGLGIKLLALNYMDNMDSAQFKAGLKARNYDLVIFHTGTNMWAPKKHFDWAKSVFDHVKQALGNDVSILVLSPPDFVKRKKGKTLQAEPRMFACAREKRQITLDNKVAFWDFYEAMGGLGSVFQWRKQKLVTKNHVHYTAEFHDLMMHKFTNSLLERTRQYWMKIGMNCE